MYAEERSSRCDQRSAAAGVRIVAPDDAVSESSDSSTTGTVRRSAIAVLRCTVPNAADRLRGAKGR
jgi:hypothetical protein